jgi:tRNA-specific 2-thiouridylase
MRVTAKIRHRHPAAPATVEPAGEGRVTVTFDEPQRSITPGQAVVLYSGDEVLGGGWIE